MAKWTGQDLLASQEVAKFMYENETALVTAGMGKLPVSLWVQFSCSY